MPSRGPDGRMRGMESSPHIYVDCDVPEGMTLTEWRRSQCAAARGARRPRLWRRLLSLA